MEVYLLRHGIAETRGAAVPDAERALTPEGRKKLRVVLKVAARAGVSPDVILTSPLRRAVETAQMAAEALGFKGEIETTRALAPEGSPEEIWSEIRRLKDANQVVLAGHEPLIGCFAAYLVGGPAGMIDVKKGSIIRIDVESLGPRPRGMLRWILTPALAEAIAG